MNEHADGSVPVLAPPAGPPDPDQLLDAFTDWAAAAGFELYPAQEEAILGLFAGEHVVIATPTGSGKSLVATAGHFDALARGQVSVYTAPIKALVSEKFFDLRTVFGAENVGMVTGDSRINADAPIICCTAEILANNALQVGRSLPVAHISADEFHFYSDRDRGWAWQVPLLELVDARFLVMSATLGDTSWLIEDLQTRTGRTVTLVEGGPRPVPLDFDYAEIPLHESVTELVRTGRAPVYVVHFTQKAATAQAQSFLSLDLLTKEEKGRVNELLAGFRFDTPFGKDLKRFCLGGVGVHHAGLLPRYRLLVERLAKEGLLKLICGTDTLGVGVNIPIRTVLLTQLCKYDGSRTRILTVREFQQIAGRAGRRGYDTEGTVWVQAPAHWIENKRAENKATQAGRRLKNRKKAPEFGYKDWSRDTFTRLATGVPEALSSSFAVTHGMVLHVLSRPGDGEAALRGLVAESHENDRRTAEHLARIDDIIGGLVDAGIVERLDAPDPSGRSLRVAVELQDEFALDRPLSPFVVDLLSVFATPDAPVPSDTDDDGQGEGEREGAPAAPAAPAHPYAAALDMVSVVEASLDDPIPILNAQRDQLRDAEWNRLRAEGVEHDERKARVAEITWPRPLADQLDHAFGIHLRTHPWLAGEWVRPKSVARELFERGDTFAGAIHHWGIARSEGLLLRYLTDCYRALVRNVPAAVRTEEFEEITEWLGTLVRGVDASLLDEWDRIERIAAGEQAASAGDAETPPADAAAGDFHDVTANRRGFRAMVRTEVFRWVQALARRDHRMVAELPAVRAGDPEVRAAEITATMAPYWEEWDSLAIDAPARGAEWFEFDDAPAPGRVGPGQPRSGCVRVTQILCDPEATGEWRVHGEVDLDASREQRRAVVRFDGIEHRI